jgi:hypothetical protein
LTVLLRCRTTLWWTGFYLLGTRGCFWLRWHQRSSWKLMKPSKQVVVSHCNFIWKKKGNIKLCTHGLWIIYILWIRSISLKTESVCVMVSVFDSSVVDRGFYKTINLICAASPLSTQHKMYEQRVVGSESWWCVRVGRHVYLRTVVSVS